MSHQIKYNIRPAKIHAEVILENIHSQIQQLHLRDDVYKKMLDDFKYYDIKRKLESLPDITYDHDLFNQIRQLENRANSMFAAREQYIAYNFDLEIVDYNKAIEETEYLWVDNTSDTIVSEAIKTTDDELYRMYIISTAKKQKFTDKDELLIMARENLEKSKLYKKRAIQNANKMFQEKNIDKKISIEQDVEKEISAVTCETNKQIVDKEVRNRVLIAIIKIIRNQGFIVKKENVEECGDYARIYSIKPNGEKANFVVYLDGRFAYKFHDYKGLSCEKDIEDFEKKFVDIYGVQLENKNIIWSNPDRLDKMAHQTVDNKRIGG